MARKALDALSRATFRPDTVSPSFVTLVALTPPVVAGLLLFGLPALRLLGLAVLVGAAVHVAAKLSRQPLGLTPVVPAVVGVAFVGPGASPAWAATIALMASALELARARFVPGARLELGVIGYAVAFLAARGAVAAYLAPHSLNSTAEPIRLWLQYYGAGQAPIDPVRLYVGNLPGPVFATSVLAVALGAAWLWYARRLALLVVLTFGLGAVCSVKLMGWSVPYQLDSGPLWFAGALVLADRRLLPSSRRVQALLGLAAGVVVMGARARGVAIEAAPIAVAALQVVVAAVEGICWLVPNRHRLGQAARAAGVPSLSTRRLSGRVRPS